MATHRLALAATCCVAIFLYALYFGGFSVLLLYIGPSFGLRSAAEASLFPANFAGFVVGVLVCGYLSDRFGRKRVLLMAIGSYAIGLALFGKAPVFGLALLATCLMGVGAGSMESVVCALVADLYPECRALSLNAIQVAFGVGAACGPILAHELLGRITIWHTICLCLSVANALVFFVLLLQRVPVMEHPGEALHWKALRDVLRQPVFLMLCLAQALYVGAETGFFSWMPTYFEHQIPDGAVWSGLVATVFWIAMTLGRGITGILLGRIALLRLTGLLAIGGAIGSALALVWTNPLTVLVFVAWTGLCFSGIFGLIVAEAGERYPRIAGSVFGAIMAAGGLGGAAVPKLVGVLADSDLGWRGSLTVIPLLVCGIAGLAFLLGGRTNVAQSRILITRRNIRENGEQ